MNTDTNDKYDCCILRIQNGLFAKLQCCTIRQDSMERSLFTAGGAVQIRKARALKTCPPSELARHIFAPLGSCALKFCPPPRAPLTFGLNTLTCKFIRRYESSICLTHHPKMIFHSRYIDESSGIVLNGICRVAAANIFKGIF